MNNEPQQFSLDELSLLVKLPLRTVRFYIQQGLVDRPVGQGRGAHYTHRHLAQLLEIVKWQQAGLSLERIGELLHNSAGDKPPLPPPRAPKPGQVEVWSRIHLHDGLELHLEPSRAGLTPEQLRELAREVLALYQSLTKGREQQ